MIMLSWRVHRNKIGQSTLLFRHQSTGKLMLHTPVHVQTLLLLKTHFLSCSSTSVCFAPLFQPQHQTEEHSQPRGLTSTSIQQSEAEISQLQLSVGCEEQRTPPAQTWTKSTPVTTSRSHMMSSPVMRGQGASTSEPCPAGPPVRRSRLLSCLPLCLQDITC